MFWETTVALLLSNAYVLPLQFTEKRNREKTSGLLREGWSPSPPRTFFLRLLFQVRIFSNRILWNCRISAFILSTWEWQGAGYWADKVAEGGNPCPSPWTGSSEPSRDESTPIGTALLQRWTLRAPCLVPSPCHWRIWRSLPQPGTFLQWESPWSFSQPCTTGEIRTKQERATTWLEIWYRNLPGWN